MTVRRTLIPDIALAGLVALAIHALPSEAFSAGEEGGNGPGVPDGGLTTEGDGEPKPCECDETESAGQASWTETCVLASGSLGALGIIGAFGSALDDLANSLDEQKFRTMHWMQSGGLTDGSEPPDISGPAFDGGSFEDDGYGMYDSTTVSCEQEWEHSKEELVGDCEGVLNPPACGTENWDSNWSCDLCPLGYQLPASVQPPKQQPGTSGGGAP